MRQKRKEAVLEPYMRSTTTQTKYDTSNITAETLLSAMQKLEELQAAQPKSDVLNEDGSLTLTRKQYDAVRKYLIDDDNNVLGDNPIALFGLKINIKEDKHKWQRK